MSTIENKLINMKKASAGLANANSDIKNKALENIAINLEKNAQKIIDANLIDIKNAEQENLAGPLLKRLKLDEQKIDDLITGTRSLKSLPDPVNIILSQTQMDTDLILTKKSVPIGVIGIIFESRPDALVQIATLCIKSGNCTLLKGGREALETNRVLFDIINKSIIETNKVFIDTLFLLESREDVNEILNFNQYINLIIPRGSNEFVKYIQKNSSIPVLGHSDGICHVFIDHNAELNKALDITIDSKTQYVAACNSMETLLVHKDIAKIFLPVLKDKADSLKIKLNGDQKVQQIISGVDDVFDWKIEYLDYILSIKIVYDVNEAIEHINKYGSSHTDSIVSNDNVNIELFKNLVDSSSVMINCSTRFSDGFKYGLGAEVGISTSKIHSRGPVGLEGLVIYKYIVEGKGNIVVDYADGKKIFKHKKII